MVAGDPLLARAWAALAGVHDPEIPVLDIVEMGIARDVAIEGDGIAVTITPTYSGCPAMHAIEADIRRALDAAGLGTARVRTVHAPPWTTDWMTEAARAKLAAFGIAPPVRGAAVACPRCGSARTERLSEFGSTACKALHRCLDCREPFDRFKCI